MTHKDARWDKIYSLFKSLEHKDQTVVADRYHLYRCSLTGISTSEAMEDAMSDYGFYRPPVAPTKGGAEEYDDILAAEATFKALQEG